MATREIVGTVYIVDDDAIVRKSLIALMVQFGFDAHGFASAREFLFLDSLARPSCLILDLQMDEISGIELQKTLNDYGASIPVIVLTGNGDVDSACNVLRRGAHAFLAKPHNPVELHGFIRECLSTDSESLDRESADDEFESIVDHLTGRQREAFHLLVSDKMGTEDIADRMGITRKTLEGYAHHIYGAFGVNSRIQLTRVALRIDLLRDLVEDSGK